MQKLLILIILSLVFPANVFADKNDYFLLLKNSKVNVRYGPGFDYPIKYFYKKKNLPVKIIDKFWEWKKIIDLKKNSGWIHDTQLKKGRSIILLKDQTLFSRPSKYSRPILKIEKGRLLLVKKCKKKWCKIKTKNYKGWIEKNNVWGNIE